MAKRKQCIPQKGNNPVMAALQQRHSENILIRSASKANMLITCMVLHSKFGWGEKRIGRFWRNTEKC